MADTKYTPGPWKANQINQYLDFEVTAPDRNNADGFLVVKRIEGINSEANAHLIAAAPELLGALKWALRVHFDILKRHSEPWTDAAKAAITKATEPS